MDLQAHSTQNKVFIVSSFLKSTSKILIGITMFSLLEKSEFNFPFKICAYVCFFFIMSAFLHMIHTTILVTIKNKRMNWLGE